jgi:hypothetical protein
MLCCRSWLGRTAPMTVLYDVGLPPIISNRHTAARVTDQYVRYRRDIRLRFRGRGRGLR